MMRSQLPGMGLLLSAATLALSVLNLPAAAAAADSDGPAANVTAKRLAKAESEPGQWMTYGGTYSEQRFSTLKQINSSTITDLGLKWFADYETNQDQHG